jgi:hypothetical protein
MLIAAAPGGQARGCSPQQRIAYVGRIPVAAEAEEPAVFRRLNDPLQMIDV